MGYGAGYYTYMWSRAFSRDIFNEVKNAGLESDEASAMVRGLLSPGGSVPADVLVKDLLGREMSMDAIREFPVEDRGGINRSKFGWVLK